MPFTMSRPPHPPVLLILLLLCLALASSGCATRSTRASLARIDRPTLPQLPVELAKTERLRPLTAKPSGEMVAVDRSILAEVFERLAEAVAAVERANRRASAVAEERACIAELYATGTAPAGCVSP